MRHILWLYHVDSLERFCHWGPMAYYIPRKQPIADLYDWRPTLFARTACQPSPGSCSAAACKTRFPYYRWHGPADSIYAAHRTDNELDVRAGFGSTIAAFISASGGAPVGQYGPLVHFGATMGSFLRQMTGGVLTTDVFIGCGVAGAIAAGFNAPIAGLVFAHEAILRHFP